MLGDTSVCFLFDELDKVLADYDDSFLLQVLDGSDTKGKHMICLPVMMTVRYQSI